MYIYIYNDIYIYIQISIGMYINISIYMHYLSISNSLSNSDLPAFECSASLQQSGRGCSRDLRQARGWRSTVTWPRENPGHGYHRGQHMAIFMGVETMINYKTLGTYGNCHMILTMINQTLLGIYGNFHGSLTMTNYDLLGKYIFFTMNN